MNGKRIGMHGNAGKWRVNELEWMGKNGNEGEWREMNWNAWE
jgi:hypothetical protein